MPLQCTQDRVSDELGGMALRDVVVNITPPIIVGDCIIQGRVLKYQETQSFGLAISRAPFAVPALIHPTVVVCYATLSATMVYMDVSVLYVTMSSHSSTSVLLSEPNAVSDWSSLAEWNVLQNSCGTLLG